MSFHHFLTLRLFHKRSALHLLLKPSIIAAKAYGVPRSTLTDFYNGVGTRQEAHKFQQLLSAAQERILADWAKVQARQGVPISPSTLADHASDIAGCPSLEQCRANNVNHPTFNIPIKNIYNMDEKGIQLGVGKHIAAIVDRNQKNVYNLEHGNCELVTIIETVCANGSALQPTVIFEGKRMNLGWTKKNPCHASVACSPNGWTDQELGAKLLGGDFEPMSAAHNKTGGYQLLILDGHNSHLVMVKGNPGVELG
ncbi:hypothetical protein BYT27DRAFT_7221312 [Phlegmacium glaucopus]|nr:hypothetical protein BYT27DRAFT_7221312 [Phlegmacium glaucopus]